MAPWWPATSLLSVKAPRKLVFLFTLSLSVTYLFYSLLSCYTSLQFPLQEAGIYLQADSGLSPVDVIRTASLKPDTSNGDLFISGSGDPVRKSNNVTSRSSTDRDGDVDAELKSSGGISVPLAASSVLEFSNSVPSTASFSRIRTLNTVLQPGWPTIRSSTPAQASTQGLGSFETQKERVLGPGDFTVSRKSPREVFQIPSTAVSVSTLSRTPILSTLDRATIAAAQGFSTLDRAPHAQGSSTLDKASPAAQGISTLDSTPIAQGSLDRAPIASAQGFSTVDSTPIAAQGFSTFQSSPIAPGSSTLDRSPIITVQGSSTSVDTSQVSSSLDSAPVSAFSQDLSTVDSAPIFSSAPVPSTLDSAPKIHLPHDPGADLSLQKSAEVTKESYQQTVSISSDSTAIPSASPRLDDYSTADTAPSPKSDPPTYMLQDTYPRIPAPGETDRNTDFTGNDMPIPLKEISTWDSTPLAATEMIPESHTGYLERETQESSTTEEELSRRLSVNSTIEYGEKKLPQAIIIGVKKGGTRALLEALRAHPDVRAVGMEPHFFDRNYEKGLEWYRDLMPRTVEGQITMEKTPSYFVTNEAPQRIHSMAKDTKLIVVVRNPVTRAISDYTQTLSKKPEIPTFEVLAFKNRTLGLIDASWSALRIGIYALHLESWMQYFPLSQILFVSGERLISNPAEELAKVQDFLGLQRIITDKHFYFNKTKGFPCLKKPEDTGAPRCLGKSKGRTHPKIDPDVIQRLRKFYKPFNAMFYQMTGQNFEWEKEELES
ncbi:uncharacterized protein [Engystomops pustulosus]|uniref:uncharacterized protein n=1 Tax=Engystomops pustulosus TaxID=76066 RepID=UPI003AFB1F93